MKKIGILTLPLKSNYGGIMQAFALHKVVGSLGFEPLLINIQFKTNKFVEIPKLIVKFFFNFLFQKEKLIIYPSITQTEHLYSNNIRFIDDYFNKTNEVRTLSDYNLIDNYKIEGFVVGSDQVWRKEYSKSIDFFNYFFNFLSKNDKVLKIAYAASFGLDYWQFNKKETDIIKKLLLKFNGISLRENQGAQLLLENTGIDSIDVLDPTLLLNAEFYTSFFKIPKKKNPHLFTYILDDKYYSEKKINEICEIFNLEKSSLNMTLRKSKLGIIKNSNLPFPSVIEWIGHFRNSEFILTDSFHGMVFSIIFNKKFLVFANKSRGISRFESLLNKLNLESRLIHDFSQINKNLLDQEIDYKLVNKLLDKERERSIEFLQFNLSK
ncbi:polysaccharide pyruvyl transferase family protein [Belliella aquatica]|uniref:Polysaccharide pyruvyl transferase domain-containing protein n=1 Tax=Belliella aquatica TaxID=1323734 RepID=A0ABQ1MGG9_9BACT|nr:polysaccharide pyruvyl transferase family protein [Belliella aquatica]MCH7405689.1 polysaccharide pyruvyl transferase family protein [Belliella aquatica]GGC37028.1 hypothetical protein GCM10010993_14840 [Belliella aquatica]